MIQVVHVHGNEQLEAARSLILEYADFLGFDLGFQGFQEEIANLPGEYAPPEGRLLLALCDDREAGCVALRKIDGEVCEMKRLFVQPEYRGKRIGKMLAQAIIQEARGAGYKRMRLDTVAALADAIRLYRSLAFREIAPYRYNPIEGATFWELEL